MDLAPSETADRQPRSISAQLLSLLIDRINVGILTVDPSGTVLQWNRFLEAQSDLRANEVVGRNLFERFPDLPRDWLERKLRSVFLLKNFSFTSWRQRPYLFHFEDHRPITGKTVAMRQDCAFVPLLEEGTVKAVSIVLTDATDTYESETRLDLALGELAVLSERDGLTSLFNRRKLHEIMEAELRRSQRYGNQLSVVMFDIDHFKRVNDTLGHLAGDEVIRHVARMAVQALRSTDMVARYGGEEFVALLPEVPLDGALVAAERIRASIERQAVVLEGGATCPVTISAGVTNVHPSIRDPRDLLAEADAALYRSKKEGRNRVTASRAPG